MYCRADQCSECGVYDLVNEDYEADEPGGVDLICRVRLLRDNGAVIMDSLYVLMFDWIKREDLWGTSL